MLIHSEEKLRRSERSEFRSEQNQIRSERNEKLLVHFECVLSCRQLSFREQLLSSPLAPKLPIGIAIHRPHLVIPPRRLLTLGSSGRLITDSEQCAKWLGRYDHVEEPGCWERERDALMAELGIPARVPKPVPGGLGAMIKPHLLISREDQALT